jgi:hypothetical protein
VVGFASSEGRHLSDSVVNSHEVGVLCELGDDFLKDRIGDQRGGSEWEPIKILSQKNSAYIPIATPRVTHEQAEAHTNLSRYLRNKA